MQKILYEDNEIIVCEKPSGIPSQADKTGDTDMLSDVRDYIANHPLGKNSDIYLIHRLDRNVGGIMVFAKTKAAAAALSQSIREGNFKKTYLAVVEGRPEKEYFLEHYLLKNQRLNISKVVPENTPNSKRASLQYILLDQRETDGGLLSLLKINLFTGRHHQIRVQLSSAGLPIWGDVKYNVGFIKKPGFHTIALWAGELGFPHPKTAAPLIFKSMPHEKFPFTVF